MRTQIVTLVAALALWGLAACSAKQADMPPAEEMPAVEAAVPAEEIPVDVKMIQKKLNMQGARLRVDGKLGPRTKKAISAFQAEQGLPVTGELDSETVARING